MATTIRTVSHEDNAGFVPAVVDTDIKPPGKLGVPYKAVRDAVKKTHASVRELWGAVYAFGLECRKDENAAAFKKVCSSHDIVAKKGSSPFTQAVKLAIGKPTWSDEANKIILEVDDVQVFRFCKAFDAAFGDKVMTATDFVGWVNDPKRGGGSIQKAVEKGTKVKSGTNGLEGLDADMFQVALTNLRNRLADGFSGLLSEKAESVRDGHYTVIVTVVDGKPVLDFVDPLDDDDFEQTIEKCLGDEDKPRDLFDALRFIKRDTTDFVHVTVEFSDNRCSYGGKDKNGVSYDPKEFACKPGIPNTSLAIVSKTMKELGKCLRLFKDAEWRLIEENGSPVIEIAMADQQTVQGVLDRINEGKDRKIGVIEPAERLRDDTVIHIPVPIADETTEKA